MKIGQCHQRSFSQFLDFRKSLKTAFPVAVSPYMDIDKLYITIHRGTTGWPSTLLHILDTEWLSVCPKPKRAVLYTEGAIPAGPGNVLLPNRPKELDFPHRKKITLLPLHLSVRTGSFLAAWACCSFFFLFAHCRHLQNSGIKQSPHYLCVGKHFSAQYPQL